MGRVLCPKCGRGLFNKEVLEIHMRNHEREVFPGKIWIAGPVRLDRDMTHSTDWNLICHSTEKSLS